MKGVVLSGGAGTRLRPITFSMAKQLVPVANVPILFYGLRDIAAAGITEVAIIIAPETGDEIRHAVGNGSKLGLDVTYIVQDKPAGLAHALGMALPWADGDDVLMYLGDNLVKQGVADIVADFETNRPNCQILLTEVDDPSAFGVAALDDEGHVVRLVEKPKNPPSNLALVGVYLFDATIAEAVASITPSARGELEITDAIQYLVTSGRIVRPSVVRGWWKDTGKKDDLLHANELVLADLEARQEGEVIDSTIRGSVSIGAGARLIDCDGDRVRRHRRRGQPDPHPDRSQHGDRDGCRVSDSTHRDVDRHGRARSPRMEAAETLFWGEITSTARGRSRWVSPK